jgi:hypothetical protein
MRGSAVWLPVFLSISTLAASAQKPIVQRLAYPCTTVIEGATAFYTERGITITPVNPLPDEHTLGLKQRVRGRYAIGGGIRRKGAAPRPLLDAFGNRVKSTREAMRSYTEPFQYKPRFPDWGTFDSFRIRGGTLEVETDNEGCRVSLLHDYSVQWIVWRLFFPINDGPGSPKSNGRLEREYLVEIEQRLSGRAAEVPPQCRTGAQARNRDGGAMVRSPATEKMWPEIGSDCPLNRWGQLGSRPPGRDTGR